MSNAIHEGQSQVSSRTPLTTPEISSRDGQRLFLDGRLKSELIRPIPDVSVDSRLAKRIDALERRA